VIRPFQMVSSRAAPYPVRSGRSASFFSNVRRLIPFFDSQKIAIDVFLPRPVLDLSERSIPRRPFFSGRARRTSSFRSSRQQAPFQAASAVVKPSCAFPASCTGRCPPRRCERPCDTTGVHMCRPRKTSPLPFSLRDGPSFHRALRLKGTVLPFTRRGRFLFALPLSPPLDLAGISLLLKRSPVSLDPWSSLRTRMIRECTLQASQRVKCLFSPERRHDSFYGAEEVFVVSPPSENGLRWSPWPFQRSHRLHVTASCTRFS